MLFIVMVPCAWMEIMAEPNIMNLTVTENGRNNRKQKNLLWHLTERLMRIILGMMMTITSHNREIYSALSKMTAKKNNYLTIRPLKWVVQKSLFKSVILETAIKPTRIMEKVSLKHLV